MADDAIAPLYQVDRFMFPATEVEMIEFLKTSKEIVQNSDDLKRVRKLLLNAQGKKGEKSDGSPSTLASS